MNYIVTDRLSERHEKFGDELHYAKGNSLVLGSTIIKSSAKGIPDARDFFFGEDLSDDKPTTPSALDIGTTTHYYVEHGCVPPDLIELPPGRGRKRGQGIQWKPEEIDKVILRAKTLRNYLVYAEKALGWEDFKKTQEADYFLSAREFADLTGVKQWLELSDFVSKNTSFTEGVCFRARPDLILHRKNPLIVDFKTTKETSLKGITRSIATFSYHIQAYLYCLILSTVTGVSPLCDFRFLFVTDPGAPSMGRTELTPVFDIGLDMTDSYWQDSAIRSLSIASLNLLTLLRTKEDSLLIASEDIVCTAYTRKIID